MMQGSRPGAPAPPASSADARAARRVLIVKTSSMGDVVHALPAVTDMLAAEPSLRVDWLVERAFADIPRLHPGVGEVFPLAWRKWRKRLWDSDTREAIVQLRDALRREPYDLVLDLQGLLKSALWGLQARGPLVGYDRHSAREPLAALTYRHTASVSRDAHAVDRNRRLAAAHLGHAVPATAAKFGIRPPPGTWMPQAPFAALVIGGSRPQSMWPDDRWTAVAEHVLSLGLRPVPIWGNLDEQARALRLCQAAGGDASKDLPPFLSILDTAAVLGRARVVVGHDTGFTHLAAALGVPTVGLNVDHDAGHTGVTGPGPVARLGGKDNPPATHDVLAALRGMGLG